MNNVLTKDVAMPVAVEELRFPLSNSTKPLPRIMTPKQAYTFDYPEAIDLTMQQMHVFWPPDEIEVAKDIQSLKTDCTAAEYHGIVSGLRLFTHYELKVGAEHWGNVIMNMFPRPDIQRMASCFQFFELNVHAPFYNEINKALNLDTDEFYLDYVKDPVLRDRILFVDKYLDPSDPLMSLGTFAMVEGGVLYSNFAFFKHFQNNGKNKMTNVVAGINFSVRDENIHHLGGAFLYRQTALELGLTSYEMKLLKEAIEGIAIKIKEHEYQIIAKTFELGPIDGISAKEMEAFVDSRLDLCLQNLGHDAIFNPKENPIKDWFYKGINSYILHDFFNRTGNQYSRGWNAQKFVW